MKYKKLKTNFKDKRGTISDIFYKKNIHHVTIIKSKPNVRRGDHYHKKTTQWMYMTKGSLEYWYKPLNSKAKPKMKLLKVGDLVKTPPNEMHALKIGKNGNEFDSKKCSVEDYFGIKVICPSWKNKGVLNGFLAYKPNSIWLFDKPTDYRINENKDINHIKYYFHKKFNTGIPMELQFTTLVDYFLDEFFHKDNHLHYTSNREKKIKQYRRNKNYKRMEKNLNNVLSFLD